MELRSFALWFWVFLMFSTLYAAPPIENGVSKSLAEWRGAHYSDIHYKLDLTIEKLSSLLKGRIEIRVKLDEEAAKNDLILDWRTTQFLNDKDKPFANVTEVNGASGVGATIENEHLIIPQKTLKLGENLIKITFASPIKTSGAAITRYIDKEDGSEYIYSLFVPSDASTAFPVFDQPDLKARFQLNLFMPPDWNGVSNTNAKEFIENYNGSNGRTTYFTAYFEETKPISPYVFAFAAGKFERFIEGEAESFDAQLAKQNKNFNVKEHTRIFDVLNDTTKTKTYVRKSQAEKFKPHAQEIFRLTRECVKYLEDYFDYKFPFPKYDLVLIPEFPFGGMEHAGATFLREASIIFPSEPTKNDYISRATLIFHETAHQWFGDCVTMKWFDDLWLKEGFATFMGFKALDKIMPEMNAWKAFYERNKQSAYQTDSTKGTTPIYQEIPNLSAAKSAYGNIVYSKAPSFLRQAEFYLGEKEFQTAVRAFLKKHEFSNATWQDLVSEFEVAKKGDLKEWANNWVTKRGLNLYRSSFQKGSSANFITSKKDKFKLPKYIYRSLSENKLADEWNWEAKTKVLFKYKDGKTEVEDGEFYALASGISFDIDSLNQVAFIFPNYQDYGYGIFLLDEKSRNYILANVQNEKDDFLRSMMYGSLWDSVREAALNPKDYVELVIKNVAAEKDETIVASMLGRANTAMNYYLDDKTRESLAPKLEEILIDKMQSAETLGQRITFYRSFLNVASSEKARNVLKEILKGGNATVKERVSTQTSDTLPNGRVSAIPIKTKDKFDIVTKLFILGDKDAPQLLEDLQKTETSDDAKRYAYAARAGIATAENKSKYWNDFVNNKEISESWIESAFVPFNSVRHANLTLQFLEKALAELPNHKKNRKIFFVNGWLGAFIGGQKSEEALNIVNKFLADNPNLDRDLRLKILENVDVIERAVKIRKTFRN